MQQIQRWPSNMQLSRGIPDYKESKKAHIVGVLTSDFGLTSTFRGRNCTGSLEDHPDGL
jgi:hypothetical protein